MALLAWFLVVGMGGALALLAILVINLIMVRIMDGYWWWPTALGGKGPRDPSGE